MREDQLLEVVKKTSIEIGEQIDEELLKSILVFVIHSPLNEDRKKCQDKIRELIMRGEICEG